jgi:hypothetical protein
MVFWTVAFAAWMLTKPDVRRTTAPLFKTFFGSIFLPGVLLLAAAWSAGAIFVLIRFGEWHWEMTKVAVLWFFGIAFVAMFRGKPVDGSYLRHLVLHSLRLAAVVEFITNIHPFPLVVELLLVPLAAVLVMVQALAEGDEQYAPIRGVLAWAISLFGLVSLSFSLVYLAGHFKHVVTIEKVEAFLLPVILSAAFVPFLYIVRLFTLYQTTFHMVHFGLSDNEQLYRFTRKLILRSLRLSVARAELFETRFRGRLWNASDERDVSRVVTGFERAWDARHNPRQSRKAA